MVHLVIWRRSYLSGLWRSTQKARSQAFGSIVSQKIR
jgi:hypothetical protein